MEPPGPKTEGNLRILKVDSDDGRSECFYMPNERGGYNAPTCITKDDQREVDAENPDDVKSIRAGKRGPPPALSFIKKK